MSKPMPSTDEWLREAKAATDADKIGMYLFHNGVVRRSAKAAVRLGATETKPVAAVEFSFDENKVNAAVEQAKKLEGIYYVRVWLNEGRVEVGDDLMLVLVGGDIRPHVIDALQTLVGTIKNECVVEKEIYE